jgi:hypothetical protein
MDVPIFRPYKKLISITVRGQTFSVPENQILLRAFQHLAPDTIPYGRYCWNEECQYCRVSVVRPGGEHISQALSCKLVAEEGLQVTELAAELLWNLRRLLAPAAAESGVSSDKSPPPTDEPPNSAA